MFFIYLFITFLCSFFWNIIFLMPAKEGRWVISTGSNVSVLSKTTYDPLRKITQKMPQLLYNSFYSHSHFIIFITHITFGWKND